jgi:hypothetical protein
LRRVLVRYRSRVNDDGDKASSDSDGTSRKLWTYRPPEYRPTGKSAEESAEETSVVRAFSEECFWGAAGIMQLG